MPDVPSACQATMDRLTALEAERVALFSEWDTVQGPGEKEGLSRALADLDALIMELKLELDACTMANTPPPDQAAPVLGVITVHVSQSVKGYDDGNVLGDPKSTNIVVPGVAVVRVFVDSGVRNGYDQGSGPNVWPGITGEVVVRSAVGALVTPIPISPSKIGSARPRGQVLHREEGHSLNFLIPVPGPPLTSLDIRVWVAERRSDPGCSASISIVVPIVPPTIQPITPFLIATPLDGAPTPPALSTFRAVHAGDAVPMFPALTYVLNPAVPYTWPYGLDTLHKWEALLTVLRLGAFITGTRVSGVRAGLVSPASRAPFSGGTIGGLGSPRVLVRVPAFLTRPVASSYAHELGHALGLLHARCGRVGDVDPELPPRTSGVGWRLGAGAARFVAAGAGDLMSYCRPRWPSSTTFKRIYGNAPTL